MLEIDEVNRVVNKAAAATLKQRLSRVYSEPTLDSCGQDALRVMIVLDNDHAGEVTGQMAVSTYMKIGQDLEESGESRFPIIMWATEDDLKADVDPEA
jgi:hypothetical protein